MLKDTDNIAHWQDVTDKKPKTVLQNVPDRAAEARSGGFRHISSIAAEMALKAYDGPLLELVGGMNRGRS